MKITNLVFNMLKIDDKNYYILDQILLKCYSIRKSNQNFHFDTYISEIFLLPYHPSILEFFGSVSTKDKEISPPFNLLAENLPNSRGAQENNFNGLSTVMSTQQYCR